MKKKSLNLNKLNFIYLDLERQYINIVYTNFMELILKVFLNFNFCFYLFSVFRFFQLLGLISMICVGAAPRFSPASWFLFVGSVAFIITFLLIVVYAFNLRESTKYPLQNVLSWVRFNLLNFIYIQFLILRYEFKIKIN